MFFDCLLDSMFLAMVLEMLFMFYVIVHLIEKVNKVSCHRSFWLKDCNYDRLYKFYFSHLFVNCLSFIKIIL